MEKSTSLGEGKPADIRGMYRRLYDTFGPQRWWPGETPFEVAVGAILTQNTNWKNVEKAIVNLKGEGVLSPRGMKGLSRRRLAALIRPAGYFNVKAGRLENFMRYLSCRHGLDMARLGRTPGPKLREELLSVSGIGPETADAILLYACGKRYFVVDAYTRRIASRHGLCTERNSYDEIQELFAASLPRNVKVYNEFHALIVKLGKDFCRRGRPLCGECPLDRDAPGGGPVLSFAEP